MTTNAPQSPTSSRADARRAGQEVLSDLYEGFEQGGALGFLNRVGETMGQQAGQLYTAENMSRVFDNELNKLPPELADAIREGLSSLFNMLSGAGTEENAPDMEAQMGAELYGAGGAQSERARYNAAMDQRNEDGFAAGVTIGSGAGGAILEVNGRKISPDGRDEDENAIDEFAQQMDAIAEEQQRIWDEQIHRFADVEMTGEEWEDLAEQLSGNTPLRRRMIDRLMREGKTQAEAEEKVDKAAQVSTIMATPESQRTPEQRRILHEAENDNDVKKVVTWGAETQSNSMSREISSLSVESTRNNSIREGADVFASAPHLTAEHARAVAATAPLERSSQQIAAAPVQQPVPAANMSGLDV